MHRKIGQHSIEAVFLTPPCRFSIKTRGAKRGDEYSALRTDRGRSKKKRGGVLRGWESAISKARSSFPPSEHAISQSSFARGPMFGVGGFKTVKWGFLGETLRRRQQKGAAGIVASLATKNAILNMPIEFSPHSEM